MSTQTIEPWLREILRCPVTKSELVDGVGPDGTPELQAVEADAAGLGVNTVRRIKYQAGVDD